MTHSKFRAAFTVASLAMCMTISGSLAGFTAAAALAQDTQGTASPAPDKSVLHQGDRLGQEKTADQAGNTMTDHDVMQRIRKSVIADEALSSYAHAIKIISQNGRVTLKGPVRSLTEKKVIEAKAIDVVGAGNVIDHLSVKKREYAN